jgi:2'-5' RNA ligase
LTGSARLFLAAWPTPDLQGALGRLAASLQQECGGRALPTRNIHLTLVFLGEVARDRMANLAHLAAGITTPRFELEVDRIEYWRHNRIVWAGVTRCPDALPKLVEHLEHSLSSAGFRFDKRSHVPHVTLLRNARRGPADATLRPLPWPVSRFALVESVPRDQGRFYDVLREWPLGA